MVVRRAVLYSQDPNRPRLGSKFETSNSLQTPPTTSNADSQRERVPKAKQRRAHSGSGFSVEVARASAHTGRRPCRAKVGLEA